MGYEMGFSMSDLYPNMGGIDTSLMVNPEKDDQEALNEDTKIIDENVSKDARKKNVFLALAVMVGLVIFFGGK